SKGTEGGKTVEWVIKRVNASTEPSLERNGREDEGGDIIGECKASTEPSLERNGRHPASIVNGASQVSLQRSRPSKATEGKVRARFARVGILASTEPSLERNGRISGEAHELSRTLASTEPSLVMNCRIDK